jgi:PhoPQ-activated pathogenicity-related protein
VSSPRWGMRPVRLGLAMIAGGVSVLVTTGSARAGLDEYVKKPDPAFAWSEVGSGSTPAGTYTELKLTSQVWKGITWTHSVFVYEPAKVPVTDAMLLFITGKDNGEKPGLDDHKMAFGLAQACGARVAVLYQVPNQPLLDGKEEDELIAETFVRYLHSGDEEWPLLFPMVKSAVRAMDAVQAWAKGRGKLAARFVVSGASKRGWTTWLTGAVDDRAIAIAPMVIVMLNLGKQGPNQLKVWGQYSEQIHDYVERGLMEKVQTPSGTKLWRMVDPYTYRDRLTKPKFLINGTNDAYWTLDAIDLFWGGLQGPKYLVELPNAGHGLDQNRDWAINGLGAFFRHVVTGRSMPVLKWNFEVAKGGESTLTIHASPNPRAARLWTAESASRDFREARWESTPLGSGELPKELKEAVAQVEKQQPAVRTSPYVNTFTNTAWSITARFAPRAGSRTAVFADVEYEVDGLPYHLTTTFFEPGISPPKAE